MKSELIYEDERYDDVKVWKITEDDGRVWVKYDRFPDIEYEYLEDGEAERKILEGEEIRGAYIPSLTRKGFESAIEFLSNRNETTLPNFERSNNVIFQYESEADSKIVAEFEEVKLSIYRSIILKECIIEKVDLVNMTFGERIKEHAIDISYFYRKDKVPTEFLSIFNLKNITFCGIARFVNSRFYSNTYITESDFRKDSDFSGVFFEENINLRGSYFLMQAIFERVVFNKEAKFDEIHVGKKVLFKRSLFFGKLEFNEVNCYNEITFENCYFNELSEFNNSKFSERVSFEGIFSCESIQIKHSTFGGDCSFQNALLKNISIVHSTFEKVLYMRDIVATVAHFNNMLCMKHFYFLSDKWKETIDYMEGKVRYIKDKLQKYEDRHIEKEEDNSMKAIEKKIKIVKNQDEKVNKIIKEYLDRDSDICEVDFWDSIVQGEFRCDFQKLRPKRKPEKYFWFFETRGNIERTLKFTRNTLNAEVVLKQHKLALEMENKRESAFKIILQWKRALAEYVWLRNQYKKKGDFEDEDLAHWWASDCKTKYYRNFTTMGYDGAPAHKDEKIHQKAIRVFKNIISFLLRWIYREIVGYGVRQYSIPVTIAYTIILSTILYFIATFWGGLHIENDIRSNCSYCENFFHALYFSVITFATVGFGDIAAVYGWRLISIIEGFLGVVLNSTLVVVLFRKIVR